MEKKNWHVGVYIGTVGFIEQASTKEEAEQLAMKRVDDFIQATTSHQAALQILNAIPFDSPPRKADGIITAWVKEILLRWLLILYRR
jgi:hypothetical protein